METTSPNEIFKLAADIVRNTSQSVFLTGKAGTGKTTFLHYIRKNVDKNVIVAAPTGVASINAGGVTLHSLLQLPFEPFIPNLEGKKKLDFHFKLRKSKIEMLRELELLIIDEVSMLRADMLDAIDYMLKRYRNNQQLFGGVQILFIGDMYQLPPVAQQHEWDQLKQYYPSPFFFHAQALQNNMPLYVELKTIYRQSDQVFIDILNRIRNNCTTSGDLQILNQRYNPSFKLTAENRYIVLCTHNYKADKINSEQLDNLQTKGVSFSGKITGDFTDNSLPTDFNLVLKIGAQVMFVKNDVGEKRRYYNGKLAVISHLSKDKIVVRFEDGNEMELEEETWRNVRYSLNEDSGNIQEEELGAFTQYPIRLAWAITIHKSQGLTFDRVVIDAGQAFAAGQVYVALSRCTSLDGIVLFSRITADSIHTDQNAIAFSKEELKQDYLQQILEEEKPRYCADRLKKAFDWSPIVRSVHSLNQLAAEKNIPEKEKMQALFSQLYDKAIEEQKIAENFRRELSSILSATDPDINLLKDRVKKAVHYFHKDLQQNIILPIESHINSLKKASKVKLYLKGVREIHATLLSLLEKLEHIHYGNIELTSDLAFKQLTAPKVEEPIESEKKSKPQKGDSQRITLSLFNEGKTLKEIAAERNLSTTTIESHLSGFILTGELSIDQLISEEKQNYLLPRLKDIQPSTPLSSIKEELPKEYTYLDIKAMMNHIRWSKK
ncbi:helix-turn-helix domain-containing protein [Dysgonomonas sp. HGC4]|uniref:helix-turn-helix domain-containing protein n=1 Tax=Dysgonomonas sp. HGC4 TaxID=1658009 RepID=UPI0006800587|nr:helix-turn-helix domain-containing protein [Dysgonomonas sp. HGC4]MBD8347313.1 helix-turn-helix domain-containing protein [Dysgonomonas sp. HGC4]